jgi:type IV secretion system protein TrbF
MSLLLYYIMLRQRENKLKKIKLKEGLNQLTNKLKKFKNHKKKTKSVEELVADQLKLDHEAAKNPYLQSKMLWNDVYGDVYNRLRRSNILNYVLCGIIAFMSVGMISIANEAKVKSVPFIVKNNEAISLVGSEGNSGELQDKLAAFFVKQFIRFSRSISGDVDVNKNNEIAAYSFTHGNAGTYLRNFYLHNDPNTVARNLLTSVKIDSILPVSKSTYEVRWEQRYLSPKNGRFLYTKHFVGQFSYHYGSPSSNDEILKNNPMGFVINNFTWTQSNN